MKANADVHMVQDVDMKRDNPTLAIVVPCYNEQEVLPETNRELTSLLRTMVEEGLVSSDSFILYVNDGSRDATWSIITGLTQEYPWEVAGLNLAGNVGHQNALLAGLEASSGMADITISIDADLQDDIAAIPEMVRKFRDGADIVYGIRQSRATDTWFKRNTALAFYRLMRRLGVKSEFNHADFRLMSRRAVDQLMLYREENLFLRGLVPLIGYRQDRVYYDRKERMAGESKYPLRKMLAFAIDGITSFSVKPVRMVFLLGVIFVLIAIGIGIYVAVRHLSGHTIEGWSSMVLSIWFCSGVILLSLGVVGEYIGKIYSEVKGRPRYNVESLRRELRPGAKANPMSGEE